MRRHRCWRVTSSGGSRRGPSRASPAGTARRSAGHPLGSDRLGLDPPAPSPSWQSPGRAPPLSVVHTRPRSWRTGVEHVVLCCESFRRPASVIGFGPGALAVVAVPAGSTEESTARLGQEIVRLAGGGPLRGLRSRGQPAGSGLAALPRLRDEARCRSRSWCAQGLPVRGYADVEAEVSGAQTWWPVFPRGPLSGLDRLSSPTLRPPTAATWKAHCGPSSWPAGPLLPPPRARCPCHHRAQAARPDRFRLGTPPRPPRVRIACDLCCAGPEAIPVAKHPTAAAR